MLELRAGFLHNVKNVGKYRLQTQHTVLLRVCGHACNNPCHLGEKLIDCVVGKLGDLISMVTYRNTLKNSIRTFINRSRESLCY